MAHRRIKRIRRRAVYFLVRAFFSLAIVLPISWSRALGRTLGWLASFLPIPPSRIARRQLADVLGVSVPESRKLARGVFMHIGSVVAELAAVPRIRRVISEYVELPAASKATLDEALAVGRGVIVVTGHIGNWELLAQRVALEGYDVATLARRHPNPFLADWIVAERARSKVETIDRKDPKAARKILAALRRKAILGVLIDQDTNVRSAFVPFFGRPARTPTAAAELALRQECPVLIAYCAKGANGHSVRVERLDVSSLPEDREARTFELTTRMSHGLEAAIRAAPDRWVWFHERWKSKERVEGDA